MKYIVKCVNVSRARKCDKACQVFHGPQIYCMDYRTTGSNGTVERFCERIPK